VARQAAGVRKPCVGRFTGSVMTSVKLSRKSKMISAWMGRASFVGRTHSDTTIAPPGLSAFAASPMTKSRSGATWKQLTE
jgi:hypothetical protein